MGSTGNSSRRFQFVSETVTVQQLVFLINSVEARYVVIERSDSGFAVWPLQGKRSIQAALNAAADMLGPSILGLRLDQIPKLAQPCLPVEQNDPWSWAERWTRQEQSPTRCTVLLVEGRVADILDSVYRGDSLVALPGRRYVLFGEEIEGENDLIRVCPHCGKDIRYYEVRVHNCEPVFVCPFCRQVVEYGS